MALKRAEKDVLEAMIDHYSLSQVLSAITDICEEKAEHVRTNWNDNITAKIWQRAAKKVFKVACDDVVNSL